MPMCEKCWGDAYLPSRMCGTDQVNEYHRLMDERSVNPCTLRQQAGQWWDEEKQRDSRFENKKEN